VIDEIVAILENCGGSVADIVAKLSKKFPDRAAEGLTATVRTQMFRLKTTRNLKIKASDTSPITYTIELPYLRISEGPRGLRFRAPYASSQGSPRTRSRPRCQMPDCAPISSDPSRRAENRPPRPS
jgi:hypothetical protein